MTSAPLVAKPQATRVIKCGEHNAKEFQQIVKTTPALLSLVQSLQAQGVFPGLRAMTVTLTGAPETVAKGLAAWPELSAASRTPD